MKIKQATDLRGIEGLSLDTKTKKLTYC